MESFTPLSLVYNFTFSATLIMTPGAMSCSAGTACRRGLPWAKCDGASRWVPPCSKNPIQLYSSLQVKIYDNECCVPSIIRQVFLPSKAIPNF